MTPTAEPSPFTVKTIHARVARYLKRQEKRVQRRFWEALDLLASGPFPADDPAHIAHLKGPFHCSYRYALSRGRRGLRIKYDVNAEKREITIYDLGPRGDVYTR
jgi:mRNA-degrading endonuclease RelE of RelBE toxin-antitoxin system